MHAVRWVARHFAAVVPVVLTLVLAGLAPASAGAAAGASGTTFSAAVGVGANPFDQLSGAAVRSGSSTRAAASVRSLASVTPAVGTPPVLESVSPGEGATEGDPGNELELGLSHHGGVKLMGEHFEGATEVLFGGVPAAAFAVRSGGEIEAEPPAHEGGAVTVSVKTPAGEAELPASYRYGPVVESVERLEGGANEGSTHPPLRCLNTEKTLEECPNESERPLAVCLEKGRTLETCPPGEEQIGVFTPVKIKGRGFTGATAVNFGERCLSGSFAVAGCSTLPVGAADVEVTEHGTVILAKAPSYNVGSISGVEHLFETGVGIDVQVSSPEGTSPKSSGDHYYLGPVVESVAPQEGPTTGGNTVVIQGHGFKGPQLVCKHAGDTLQECPAAERATEVVTLVKSVKFGSTPATPFTVKSATEIEAQVPAGNTRGVDVTVTNQEVGEGGTQTITSLQHEADRYYYGPNVTSLSPHGGPVTGGEHVTIKGRGFEACKVTSKTLPECPEPTERNAIEKVSFGGVAATTFEVKSSEELVVPAVPPHAAEHAFVGLKLAGSESPELAESPRYVYGEPLIENIVPPEGDENGGTEVTLRGRNFVNVTEVSFNGLRSPRVHPVNADEVKAIVPSNVAIAGSGHFVVVKVVTEPEKSVTFTSQPLTWKALPEPQLLKVEPTSISRFGGTRVRIRGKNLLDLKAVKFGSTEASFTLKNTGEGEAGIGEVIATSPRMEPGSAYVYLVGRAGTSATVPAGLVNFPGFGIEPGSFEVAPCRSPLAMVEHEPVASETFCNYATSLPGEFFTQAAGTPAALAIAFGINATEAPGGDPGNRQPAGTLKNLRLDFPPGWNFNVQSVTRKCSLEEFEGKGGKSCPAESIVGLAEESGSAALIGEPGTDETLYHPVYVLEPEEGVPAELGFNSIGVGKHETHIIVKGGVSSSAENVKGVATGDYHVYSTVTNTNDQETPATVSRLILGGPGAHGAFITMPSQCGSSLTYHVFAESYSAKDLPGLVPPGVGNEIAEASTTTHVGSQNIGVEGCNKVPFEPELSVTPETNASGAPDAATVTVKLPQGVSEPNSADPKQVTVTLPEGMTVNPSSANGLAGCTDKQFGVAETAPGSGSFLEHPLVTENKPIECPPASRVGTFKVKTPDLPEKACKTPGQPVCAPSELVETPLEGGVYVASPVPGAGPESGEMYRLFLAAESKRFGVQVRQMASVKANPETGLLTSVVETPQLPFSEAIVHFNPGQKASLANPVACGGAPGASSIGLFTPYGGPEGPSAFQSISGALLGCPFSSPFGLSQGAGTGGTQAGANTTFALEWTRPRGQAYLAATSTTLPAGLTGSIASVPVLCTQEQVAHEGACPAASQIGSVLTAAGEGEPEPGEGLFNSKNLITLHGQVYLTTGYTSKNQKGEEQTYPYGLAIVVPATEVGPYNLGKIVTRAGILINEETAQVTTLSAVPTIVKGAPVRLRAIQIQLNRAGFMRNATHCSAGSIESGLYGTGTLPVPAGTGNTPEPTSLLKNTLNSPYAATGCGSLPFKPIFTSTTNANTSRQNGAGLIVKYTQNPGEANIQKVETQLPIALPSRLTTLQKACTETAFAANPASCPAASNVGTVVARTPLLTTPLTGTAILVSHGGRAYPDLDFVLHEVAGIKVRVVGHTEIKNGITYSRFESVPDTPVSSFELNLPSGPNSLLGANGSFCTETTTSKKKVALKRNGKVVRRKGHIVFTTQKTTHLSPVTLIMPTTMVGQNGAKLTQSTQIAVQDCKPSIGVGKATLKGDSVMVTVQLSAAGKVTLSGKGLKTTHKALGAGTHTVKVPLSKAGKTLKHDHKSVKVKATLSSGGSTSSSALTLSL